jgi:UreF
MCRAELLRRRRARGLGAQSCGPRTVVTDLPENSPKKALLHLLHLASPALPVGAYAYSHGLEHAVEAGWVRDRDSASRWVLGILDYSLACTDVPILGRLYRAWLGRDEAAVDHWNAFLCASRESAEIAAEDRHLGRALASLLVRSGTCGAGGRIRSARPCGSFPSGRRTDSESFSPRWSGFRKP